MRLLLENNLSPRLVPFLKDAGHDVAHVRGLGLASAPDTDVLDRARQDQRVLISADTDFGTLLARSGTREPSVILLRRTEGRRSARVAELLAANLPQLEEDLAAGAVAVIRDDNVRVRRLPFAPGHQGKPTAAP